MEKHVESSTWHSAEHSSRSEAVARSLENYNELPQAQLYERLAQSISKDEETGLIYSRIGMPEDSKEAAIAVSSPYANGLEPHRLALSALHYAVARRSGIADSEGNPLSVITMGSPTVENRLALNRNDKANMVEGLANREIELLERQRIGRVALLGFSQGADVSMAAANAARDMEVAHVSAGDPVRVRERGRLELMRDMTQVSIPEVKQEMADGGFEFQSESYEKYGRIGNFMLSSAMPTNLVYMTRALSVDELSGETLGIAKNSSITIGYGSESAISQERDMMRARRNIEAAYDSDSMERIDFIRMQGKNHAWGDNAAMLSGFYFDKMPERV